jgi:hypothetical protein
MKFQALIALTATVTAQENAGGNGAGKPNWVEIDFGDLRYPSDRTLWPTCGSNSDCDSGHVCANHMWEYNGQSESARGCWEFAVCSDTGSYNMFDGRKIQWFCDSYSTHAADGLEAPYGLERSDSAHWDSFQSGCVDNTQCPNNQFCTYFLWDGTQDGRSYGNGSACYIQDEGRCPSEQHWGTVNANYWGPDGTGFSAYTQQDCAPVVEGAYSVSVGIALAFMMFLTSM